MRTLFLSALLLGALPLAAQTPVTVPPSGMVVDSGTRTVTFDLVAGETRANGSLNFNGYKGGALTFVAPRGWTVVFQFSNRDKSLPHSAQVITARQPVPMGPVEPAFPGATSTDPEVGITADHQMEPVRFVARSAGEYIVFCAVPGHGMAGMWVKLAISDGATPSIVR